MVRRRSANLDREKQQRLLRACTMEMATHGYRDASLNRILEMSAIGKSTAYHYFEDKADLCAWAIEHCWADFIASIDIEIDQLTSATFWPTLQKLYEAQLETPEPEGSIWSSLRALREMLMDETVAKEVRTRFRMQRSWMRQLLEQGQQIGAVRTDLPRGLLVAVVAAIDAAGDEWLHRDGSRLPLSERRKHAAQTFSIIRTAVEPKNEGRICPP